MPRWENGIYKGEACTGLAQNHPDYPRGREGEVGQGRWTFRALSGAPGTRLLFDLLSGSSQLLS